MHATMVYLLMIAPLTYWPYWNLPLVIGLLLIGMASARRVQVELDTTSVALPSKEGMETTPPDCCLEVLFGYGCRPFWADCMREGPSRWGRGGTVDSSDSESEGDRSDDDDEDRIPEHAKSSPYKMSFPGSKRVGGSKEFSPLSSPKRQQEEVGPEEGIRKPPEQNLPRRSSSIPPSDVKRIELTKRRPSKQQLDPDRTDDPTEDAETIADSAGGTAGRGGPPGGTARGRGGEYAAGSGRGRGGGKAGGGAGDSDSGSEMPFPTD
eukprot:GHVU01190116.1.p2 GENE.GHVU01190116.1~~GHVU01190116.1.p2  ORF type:complete len:265 (-),score=27.60 GHVU01190116.1:1830-2624(-)